MYAGHRVYLYKAFRSPKIAPYLLSPFSLSSSASRECLKWFLDPVYPSLASTQCFNLFFCSPLNIPGDHCLHASCDRELSPSCGTPLPSWYNPNSHRVLYDGSDDTESEFTEHLLHTRYYFRSFIGIGSPTLFGSVSPHCPLCCPLPASNSSFSVHFHSLFPLLGALSLPLRVL